MTSAAYSGFEPLAVLAEMAVPADPGRPTAEDAFELSSQDYRARDEAHCAARWAADARVLAAAGIRPGPAERARDAALRISWQQRAPLVVLAWDLDLWLPDGDARADRQDERTPGPMLHPLPAAGPDVPGAPARELRDEWRALVHQTNGICCTQRYVAGLVLAPAAAAGWLAADLDAWGCGAVCSAAGRLPLSSVAAYRDLLARHGVSAEHSWAALAEGAYPIDATASNLRALVHPDDLARLAATSDRSAWAAADDGGLDASASFGTDLSELGSSALTLDWFSTPSADIGDVDEDAPFDAVLARWHARSVGFTSATLWVLGSNCD